MSSRTDLTHALVALVRLIRFADTLGAVRSGSVFANAERVAWSAAKGNIAPLAWTAFEKVPHMPPGEAQIAAIAASSGFSVDQVRAQFAETLAREALWVNSRYQVALRQPGPALVHLSIKRVDQAAVHDWRDLQRIKDELVGPECEAVELYPARSRLVDTVTQYHLWCVTDPAYRFPFGFTERLVSHDSGPHAQREQEA